MIDAWNETLATIREMWALVVLGGLCAAGWFAGMFVLAALLLEIVLG
jgi:hypothetical protein